MASKNDDRETTTRDTNPDPITGAPGSHPVGTGVGAAGGGAAGAAIGSIGGPVGTAIGAVAGAIAGGLAGKGVAESIDPTAEDAYWRENYKTRPYAVTGETYDTYAPAYRYGWESRSRYAGKNFDEIEPDLRTDWEREHGKAGGFGWDRAKLAVRDAWDHVSGSAHRAAAAGAGAATTQRVNEGEARVPIIEEEVRIGKQQVRGAGGVRVQSRVVEKPVEEQVNLREEHVHVERRPVDRPVTGADLNNAFQEKTIEARETVERPVVAKQAKVVEEVVINKDVQQRTETVRDTARRTEVDVEKLSGEERRASANRTDAAKNSGR